jgi:hypothetical protein
MAQRLMLRVQPESMRNAVGCFSRGPSRQTRSASDCTATSGASKRIK